MDASNTKLHKVLLIPYKAFLDSYVIFSHSKKYFKNGNKME